MPEGFSISRSWRNENRIGRLKICIDGSNCTINVVARAWLCSRMRGVWRTRMIGLQERLYSSTHSVALNLSLGSFIAGLNFAA